MFHPTALYHGSPKPGDKIPSWPSTKREKDHPQQKFLRLNSLEGDCYTYQTPSKMSSPSTSSSAASTKVDKNLPPSQKEAKWFNFQQPQTNHYYPPTHLYNNHHQHNAFEFWPQQYQVPFNLTKGQFEVMELMQDQVHYVSYSQPHQQQEEMSFSKCVTSLVQWGSSLASSLFREEAKPHCCTNASKVSLNPNAKEFTMPSLNPNAKEFHPKQNVPVTPPNEEVAQLKTVAQRKCTPWVHPKGEIEEIDVEADFEDEDDEESEEEDDDDEEDEGCATRQRLLSICSSEDGFIQFEESPKVEPKIDREKCTPFLKNFLAGNESSEDDEDDEDDEDWDTTVTSSEFVCCDDILDDLRLTGLSIPLTVDLGSKAKGQDVLDNARREIEAFPDLDRDYQEVLRRVKEANAKWNELDCNGSSVTSKVTFCEPLVTSVKLEDPEMSEELRAARINETSCAQTRADQDRYNRLLAPIFTPEHRDKIRSYIEKRYLTQT